MVTIFSEITPWYYIPRLTDKRGAEHYDSVSIVGAYRRFCVDPDRPTFVGTGTGWLIRIGPVSDQCRTG